VSRFDPRKLLGIGIVGAAFSMWQLSTINLDAGYWEIFWPQFLQGVSLSLLFVPLTTVTMGGIARESMGYATSMFNLLRNLGGGVGIAFATTYLSRQQQVHQSILAAHVDPLNPVAQNMLGTIAASMQAGGTDATLAMRRAYGAIQGMVERQAMMLSFLDSFRFMAVVFVLVLPLLLLLRRAKGKGEVAAH
jgi:DHA2 family multidrug resistance protein